MTLRHELALGTDEQYLNCWLQFNVAYRANVAAACCAAAVGAGRATRVAAALECFQQYLSVLEDIASWMAILESWPQNGSPLVQVAEKADTKKWSALKRLKEADRETLVELFRLPSPADAEDSHRGAYEALLDGWLPAVHDIGEFISREAQNGGLLAHRLQNKVKHGLHFSVAIEGSVTRATFYPHEIDTPPGVSQELPRLTLDAESAERWTRRTYDASRLLAALLRTIFVARFQKDPPGAWRPRTEPNVSLSLEEIGENLQLLNVPVVEWNDSAATR